MINLSISKSFHLFNIFCLILSTLALHNVQSERFIQTFKKALKAGKHEGSLKQRLARFLLSYRTAPYATTKEAPCVLLMGRPLRTRLDLLKPNHESQVVDQ